LHEQLSCHLCSVDQGPRIACNDSISLSMDRIGRYYLISISVSVISISYLYHSVSVDRDPKYRFFLPPQCHCVHSLSGHIMMMCPLTKHQKAFLSLPSPMLHSQAPTEVGHLNTTKRSLHRAGRLAAPSRIMRQPSVYRWAKCL
jgi:hypothetical protein